MRALLVMAALVSLSGCAGFVPYVQAHAVGIGAIGLVAGAASSVESAALNAWNLGEKIEEKVAK